MASILLRYEHHRLQGIFERGPDIAYSTWVRIRTYALEADPAGRANEQSIEINWRHALHVLRIASSLQRQLGFAFETDDSSRERVQQFMREYRTVREAANAVRMDISEPEIRSRLQALGWNAATHELKPYQASNLRTLLALQNGANFSVPGAGKTTVTFALHLLAPTIVDRLLVVAPRNAFMAWEEVIDECLNEHAPGHTRLPFVQLVGGEARIAELLSANPARMLISYDQLVRVESQIEELLSRSRVHLVLDEAHRMKAGTASRRGTVLLKIGYLAVRRDILTGTPMPQRPADMQSQLDFLWPGAGLGSRVSAGEPPRSVLGNLYVRTTKQQLGLGPRDRIPVPVTLTDAHLAFYAVLKSDVHAQASLLRQGRRGFNLIRARRSVMRLLQASVNPLLLAADFEAIGDAGRNELLQAVIAEGPSARVLKVVEMARQFAQDGRKTLIWTSFRSTVEQLRNLMPELEPAVIDGSTGIGDEDDDETRQGQIRRFKTDPNCKAMVANPAAASEGMSLHMVCHDAIYLDRSYNATHYLQSIDRIHRLGLPEGVRTRVHILQNRLPLDVGSIDLSVARRLGIKIRQMEAMLGDEDLHELALDEENMGSDLEDSIDTRDILDLLDEIERSVPPELDALVE
ncbi:DEAD/DEAH box helicase [Variovorax sp. J22G73]|uniref:DEAD/DEAH box helicase n=1 Tax=unclassified Variovorax TaxID=663243 RepID=UPI00257556EF|nr:MULTISPECIES: DEAD/DEAH box helicase [unclassified Variovorax]MDM0007463.1 DEAD/DEAH box helicase [Variovorax sp. J22R203]MDM0100177.1 DEAD/DEAH box helicase [Variovorax sp. J22G73]